MLNGKNFTLREILISQGILTASLTWCIREAVTDPTSAAFPPARSAPDCVIAVEELVRTVVHRLNDEGR